MLTFAWSNTGYPVDTIKFVEVKDIYFDFDINNT